MHSLATRALEAHRFRCVKVVQAYNVPQPIVLLTDQRVGTVVQCRDAIQHWLEAQVYHGG